MSEKTVYLIRHAHPAYPGGVKMCLGRRNDLPLSKKGAEQAKDLGRRFSSIPLEAVYTSPLLRARQTAQAVAGDTRPVHVLENLIELDGGAWDGLTYDQLHERFPQHFGPGAKGGCPPGGESDEDGLARIRAAMDDVQSHTNACAAVVAHAGVIRLLLCSLFALPPSEKKRFGQDYASVCTLVWRDGAWSVKEFTARRL